MTSQPRPIGRLSAEAVDRMFGYLDDLRASGETNMFAAGPFLAESFDLSPVEARKVLVAWMETFGERRAYEATDARKED